MEDKREQFEEFEEDFEMKPASYQVWLLGYADAEAITDFDHLVQSFSDAEAAVEFAKRYVETEKYKDETIPDNVAYLEVLVETVVDYEDHTENVGTLFTTTINLII